MLSELLMNSALTEFFVRYFEHLLKLMYLCSCCDYAVAKQNALD